MGKEKRSFLCGDKVVPLELEVSFLVVPFSFPCLMLSREVTNMVFFLSVEDEVNMKKVILV